MNIKDIEIEIRNGKVKPEDIINEVTRVQKAIDKEKADKRAREISMARNDVIAAMLDYMDALGYGPADEAEEDKFIKAFEDGLNDIEKVIEYQKKKPSAKKASTAKKTDAEIDDELAKIFKMWLN